MRRNLYLKYWNEAKEAFEKIQEEVPEDLDSISEEIFRTKEKGEIISKFPEVFPEKTAILVMGLFHTGKTTYINEFLKSHDFAVIRFDELFQKGLDKAVKRKYRIEPNDAEELADLHSMNLFGKAIGSNAEAKKSMILEGDWLNMVARAAIVRALKELGYTIYIVSLMDKREEELSKCYQESAINMVLSRWMIEEIYEEKGFVPVNEKERIYRSNTAEKAKFFNIDEIELKKRVKSTEDYIKAIMMMRVKHQQETVENAIPLQLETAAFLTGIDFFIYSKDAKTKY